MKKAILSLATMTLPLLLILTKAHRAQAETCERLIPAAAEDFARTYMKLSVTPDRTLIATEALDTTSGKGTYVVYTSSKFGGRKGSVKVIALSPELSNTCQIIGLEALSND